eukprot:COSAG01_NODE_8705_length_2690_cov_211.793130_1_plen_28_part_10
MLDYTYSKLISAADTLNFDIVIACYIVE